MKTILLFVLTMLTSNYILAETIRLKHGQCAIESASDSYVAYVPSAGKFTQDLGAGYSVVIQRELITRSSMYTIKILKNKTVEFSGRARLYSPGMTVPYYDDVPLELSIPHKQISVTCLAD